MGTEELLEKLWVDGNDGADMSPGNPVALAAYHKIIWLQAEVDVLNGNSCEQNQKKGRDSCGVCKNCLRKEIERLRNYKRPTCDKCVCQWDENLDEIVSLCAVHKDMIDKAAIKSIELFAEDIHKMLDDLGIPRLFK